MALSFIVAACVGIMIFVEGKKVKGVEGVPVSEKDQERLKKDEELGIFHVNNINETIPKERRHKIKPVVEKPVGGSYNGNVSNKAA